MALLQVVTKRSIKRRVDGCDVVLLPFRDNQLVDLVPESYVIGQLSIELYHRKANTCASSCPAALDFQRRESSISQLLKLNSPCSTFRWVSMTVGVATLSIEPLEPHQYSFLLDSNTTQLL